ncbi:MAG TPA: hypothetical protein VKM54_04560 [Myxococcota bacterium]|nr:hypothetical protein [Myxococcota bacterium]
MNRTMREAETPVAAYSATKTIRQAPSDGASPAFTAAATIESD